MVWGYRGNGGPRQWCSMVTYLRSSWHRFSQNVCVCVFVCAPGRSASSAFGAGLASCWDTQEENMTYIAIREGGCLALTMYTEAI